MIKLPDVTALYVILCFTIAYAILKRYLFGPLGAILDEREREEKEAAALHTETLARLQKAMAEAEQKLSLARRDALKTRESLRAEGRGRLETRLAEASSAAAASVESATGRIQKVAGELGGLLTERAQSLARELAEKILGRKLAA